GYQLCEAGSAEEAAQVLATANAPIDLIILDLMLPKMNGVTWLAGLKNDPLFRHIPVIVISGHASSEEAASAMKTGASDFFEKPLNRERVLVSVRKALDNAGMVRQLASLHAELQDRRAMLGTSPPMQQLHRQIERVAPTKANVLITGPSGTGKELVSRAIHQLSGRAEKPFVKVNCAAMPRELIESELFGHERGAFTGADAKKRGLFEQAHGATLFLDEIGDMALSAQAKVLRVLQSGEVSRVGSEHTFVVDVRVLAATNKDLSREVAAGRFREDLFFRLNVFPIRMPTLDERREDIPLLVEAFVASFCSDNGMKDKRIHTDVYVALARRRWPGNVRELKNVAERAAILSGDEITIADLPEDPHVDPFDEQDGAVTSVGGIHIAGKNVRSRGVASDSDGRPLTLREVRGQAERHHIVATLAAHDWNVSRAAIDLGVERTNLHKKIRSYGIQRGET
ncbi:MAG TPA: sigma-54-dependent Fis family transcriptional regulator, partial [Sorangium sp.]|nr:sigma-54-dependent Fis family transcriptional regulator [Sorangium sp.]